MNNDDNDPYPWLSRYARAVWSPPEVWTNKAFGIRRAFFEQHRETHANGHWICPACGYPTLTMGDRFNCCSLCHWVDDKQDAPWADYENAGPNDSLLNEARRNFAETFSVWSFAEAGDFSPSTRERLFSATAQARKKALCQHYDRLITLSDQDAIKQQWQQIKQYQTIV